MTAGSRKRPVDPRRLAREFVALLFEKASGTSDVDGVDVPKKEPVAQPRVDTVVAAVHLAFAISPFPELLRQFRGGSPIVCITTGVDELVEPLERAVSTCLLNGCVKLSQARLRSGSIEPSSERAYVIFRSGGDSVRRDANDEALTNALENRAVIVALAADPERQLNPDLVRAADWRIELGGMDGPRLAATVEAICGAGPSRDVACDLVQDVRAIDLQIAARGSRVADLMVARVEELVRRRATPPASAETLDRLSGFGAARDIGMAIAADLKAFAAGELSWSVVDRGLLLVGAPGTGKTFFAKAFAATADVPLISGSLAVWQSSREGHLGHTLAAMRRSFADARRRAPAVWFIDEIDSFGDRTTFTADHRDYSSQVVNALLECLDGAENRDGVFVLGATNHPDRIDPALRRSGRLDRIVTLRLPELDELMGVARHHLQGELDDAGLREAGVAALGATPADLAAWIRRAYANGRRVGRRKVTLDDVLDAIRDGKPDFAPGVRRRVAFHEAGHVVVTLALGVCRVGSAAITSDGGHTEILQDLTDHTVEGLTAMIAQALAGRIAERLVYGEIRSGSGGSRDSDIALATHVATAIEASFGLGEQGPLYLGEPDRVVGGNAFALVSSAVRARLRMAEETAARALAANSCTFERVAEALARETYLARQRIEELTRDLVKTPVFDWPEEHEPHMGPLQ